MRNTISTEDGTILAHLRLQPRLRQNRKTIIENQKVSKKHQFFNFTEDTKNPKLNHLKLTKIRNKNIKSLLRHHCPVAVFEAFYLCSDAYPVMRTLMTPIIGGRFHASHMPSLANKLYCGYYLFFINFQWRPRIFKTFCPLLFLVSIFCICTL